MKSLTLFRHAKTERESLTGRDIDRQLNERGEHDAARMGAEIRALQLEYDRLLSSPAARASETANLAGISPVYDERIYDAPAGRLLSIVQELDDETARLMMVGHNPGFEQLASMLLGAPVDMPTGSMVEIELPIEHWRDAGTERARLVRFVNPKELD